MVIDNVLKYSIVHFQQIINNSAYLADNIVLEVTYVMPRL